MGECALCDGDGNLPNRCKYCDQFFCANHRLPEAHDCPGLDIASRDTRRFESSFDDSVRESGTRDSAGRPVSDGEEPYEVVDPTTMGTSPEPDFEGSPDVNPDGSIARPDDDEDPNDDSNGIFRRILAIFPF